MFEKRFKEIDARKLEIRGILQDESQTPDLEKFKVELETLDTEKRALEARSAIMAGIASGTQEARSFGMPQVDNKPKYSTSIEARNSKEYRSGYFKKLMGRELSEEERAADAAANMELRFVSGGSQAVIPTVTLDLVKQKLLMVSALYPFVDKQAIKGNVKIPRENATADAVWHTEGDPINSAADTVDDVILTGFELVKIVSISRTVESMSIEAFESYLVDKLVKKLRVAIENAILNGAGTTEPTGIYTAITWTAGNQKTYASLDKLAYKDFTTLKGILKAPYHANAKFVMNANTLWNGVANILDAIGRPIFVVDPQSNLNNGSDNNYLQNVVVGRLLGTPVIMTPYANDGDILLGDLMYYVMNMIQDILIEKSYESSFKTNMIDYKGTLIADGNVVLSEAFVRSKIA